MVTGSRAEYGLLHSLMREIQNEPSFDLHLFVTGMHLMPEFGSTYREIEKDGFQISEKIDLRSSGDTDLAVTRAMGNGLIGFAEAFQKLKPELVVLLGDRYEILAAAQAAFLAKLPIAHLCGGDLTEGALDDSIRHCITKLSHLHFVSTESSAKRVRQLGEDPNQIFVVGNPGLDYLRTLPLLSRSELEKSLDFKLRERNILVTYHPVTASHEDSMLHLEEIFSALEGLDESVGVIFTGANADSGGRALNQKIETHVNTRPQMRFHNSLGQTRYWSTVAQVDLVLGNSSSGLLEAPSFKKPTVDIGDRQKGRVRAQSVVHCEPRSSEIAQAITKALALDCSNVVNPYGDGHASERIVATLKKTHNYQKFIQKKFFDL
ncbi:MAG: UDP-N-acetylglucosamine 2-epimerase [Bdellovibrionota bacterium]